MASKKDVVHIDFSKEEESGGAGRVRWPEGDYHVKITKAKFTRSSEKDTPGITVTFKVLEGKKKGKELTDTLWITPKSLQRIRLLLEAIGVKVPKSAVNLPLKKLVGKSLWIEVEDEETEGYDPRSRVAFRGFTSEDDFDADDVEEEDDDDEDEEDDDDDEDEEDEDEDDDEDDEDEDEEEEVKPKKKAKAKKGKKSKKSKKDDDDDDEVEELDLDDL